ncbi:response regulator [Sediminitomix flava]|uniref:LuxR family two component transcriptional regulator n=1 Tax=Sediminitomix flava TaxID=379075 RepID=A0A315ZGZ7_SEDFL|nr:response regulator transcription factor [Sediminitomix flava]PWJ44400.1 LuxR family two component transcriptional regulator [Sediminitomix flava]
MIQTQTIKVAIVDDYSIIADGIRLLIEPEEDLEIYGVFNNGKAFVNALEKEEEHPNVVLMDINMPIMDGIETTKHLMKNFPNINVLALSMHNEREFISGILKAGALGYVLKNTSKFELLHAIQNVANGETYISGEASKVLLSGFVKKKQTLSEKVSKREMEVLVKISEGLTTQVISEMLSISKNTVETHRKNLLYKLKAKNTAELVNIAYKKQLLGMDE